MSAETPKHHESPGNHHESPGNHDESLGQRAVDVLLYAPIGLAITVVDEFPTLVAKGRARMTSQVRAAHAVGRLTVAYGERQFERRLRGLARKQVPSAARSGPARHAEPACPTTAQQRSSIPTSPPQRWTPGPPPQGSRPTVDLAIPGYDALSASQVVRRLDGLGRPELEAVYHYESRTRGRRTILHKIGQLAGQPLEQGPGHKGHGDHGDDQSLSSS